MLLKTMIFIGWLLLTSCRYLTPNTELIHYYQASTNKPYDDVLAELEVAIAEHNFRITGHSRVGKVIRQRGSQHFPDYDTLQFCNLTHAKTLLSLSPAAIIYMPCHIVTYTQSGQTIIKTHLLPTNTNNSKLNQFAEKINTKLKYIVDFAAEE